MKSMKNIVGILSTSQPVKFGKTKSGKSIYQIKPIKKILPPFWITYGGKLQGRIIISFKFKEWNDDSKSPFGEIIKVIGLVDESNLSETLVTHYEIDRKVFKNTIILNEFESKITRKDLKHLDIFSIDPKGCIDIDDALSIEENDNKIYIGVHIAQPICWLSKQDIIDRAEVAFSTLYMEKNKNLWSDEITEKASLFVGQEKPAYSTIFTIEDNKISNIDSFPSIIINKRNTCYEKINFPNIDIYELLNETNINSMR
jgi:exosome complex exonuclease DIS3/RRP44